MAELPQGAVFAGHRIEGVAGRGGMGVVYRATHLALDHVVALKVITPELAGDPRFRERFVRESRMAVLIRHPNVVQVRHAGEEDGVLFVTMDYVDGYDLKALIGAERRLDPQRVAGIVGQLGAALDAAHERGLVHRDVKPANVLIEARDGAEHVYLTDFGLTKRMTGATELTASGAFIGTLEYMAPEQIRGGELDGRTDVYALGGVAFAAITGEPPFARVEGDVAKLYAHLNDPAPRASERAPGVDPALDPVLQRAMAKDPDERYPSAGGLARALASAAAGDRETEPLAAAPPVESTAEAALPVEPTAEATQPTAPTAAAAGPPRADSGGAARLRRPQAGRRILGVLAGFAAIAAVAGVIALVRDGDGDGDPIDAAASLVGEYGAGRLPSGVAVVDGRVLVADREGGQVLAIDARNGERVDRADLGGQIESVIEASGSVWAADAENDRVLRLDPGTLDPEGDPIAVGAYPRELAADSHGIWTTNREGDSLSVIDPATNSARTATPINGLPRALHFGPEYLWVATKNGGADGAGSVVQVDPETDETKTYPVGGAPHGVLEHEDVVWVTATDAREVRRFEADTGDPLDPIAVGEEPQGIVFGFGSIWVTCVDGGLFRIDPATGATRRLQLEPNLEGLAIGADRVWVAGGKSKGLFEVDPGS